MKSCHLPGKPIFSEYKEHTPAHQQVQIDKLGDQDQDLGPKSTLYIWQGLP